MDSMMKKFFRVPTPQRKTQPDHTNTRMCSLKAFDVPSGKGTKHTVQNTSPINKRAGTAVERARIKVWDQSYIEHHQSHHHFKYSLLSAVRENDASKVVAAIKKATIFLIKHLLSSLWYEEWFLFFELLWGRTHTRMEDIYAVFRSANMRSVYKIFDRKTYLVLRCRSSWPTLLIIQ
mmetsp:Transcript_2465/g.2974  ORF Transcript_2465/g.2974 Transcript_2465/m.2974 type:complete len:177 (-) Transcript_2465:13-543(-)